MSIGNGAEITVTTANEYIENFISDYYDTGKAPVKSMILDANILRTYLLNPDIEDIKFMLGARDIVHQGNTIQVFTLIVAGYNANGDYILTNNGLIIDQSRPCPPECPPVGKAANDFIS